MATFATHVTIEIAIIHMVKYLRLIKLLDVNFAGCVQTNVTAFPMSRSPGLHPSTYPQCHAFCITKGTTYFSMECLSDCYCYDNIPFDNISIPVDNCYGSPMQAVFNETALACASDSVFVHSDGHSLGGWKIGAVYLVKGKLIFYSNLNV